MREKIVKPERRRIVRRQDRLGALGEAVHEAAWRERRVHCWDLEPQCTEERRKKCAAHFVQRNCWDLWAAEYFPPGRKPCCHPDLDCSDCSLTTIKFSDVISVYVEVPSRTEGRRSAATAQHRPPIYCAFLYSVTKDPLVVRDDDEDDRMVFRCQRRPGIILHSTYVSDVCGSPEHQECIFYDNE